VNTVELPGYELLDVLGQGSMGSVFRARHVESGELVAVKTLQSEDPSLRRALRNEFEVLSRVEHALLVNEREIIENGNCLFLVMEFVESITLLEWIDNNDSTHRLAQAAHLLDQVCAVLEYLHSQDPPVIVRDLKPENILVRPDGTIKLIDFGVARALTEDSRTEHALKGYASAAYAPLEQYTAQATTSTASDVYALGATTYHLLSGRAPHSAIEIMTRNYNVEQELKEAHVDPRWAALVAQAMKLKAPQRPTVAEFRRRLPGRQGSGQVATAVLERPPAAPPVVPGLARATAARQQSATADNRGWWVLLVLLLLACAWLLKG
jgi:serine/threonine protein kinase